MDENIFDSHDGYNYLVKKFKIKRKTTLGKLNNIRAVLKKRLTLEELHVLKDDLEGSFESAKAGNTLVAGFAIYITLCNAAITLSINYIFKKQDQLVASGAKVTEIESSVLIVCLVLLLIGALAMFYAGRIHSRVKRTSILYSMISQIYEEKLKETEGD